MHGVRFLPRRWEERRGVMVGDGDGGDSQSGAKGADRVAGVGVGPAVSPTVLFARVALSANTPPNRLLCRRSMYLDHRPDQER